MKKMSFKGRAQQAGFTLIELIVVIVILGIMAATALPKFLDIGTDARIAKAQAGMAAVKTAMAMANGAAKVKGGNAVELGGKAYTLEDGYPTELNIAEIAGIDADYHAIPEESAVANVIEFAIDADHLTCKFTYTGATSTTPATVTGTLNATTCK